MTTLDILGFIFWSLSLKLEILCSPFSIWLRLNFQQRSKFLEVTMDQNLTCQPFMQLKEWFIKLLVLKHLNKMALWKGSINIFSMWQEHAWSNPPYLSNIGLTQFFMFSTWLIDLHFMSLIIKLLMNWCILINLAFRTSKFLELYALLLYCLYKGPNLIQEVKTVCFLTKNMELKVMSFLIFIQKYFDF